MSKKMYDQVAATATQLGVDPGLATALARAESGGRADAVSPKGAQGVMQVMPATLKDLETRHGRKLSNIEAGTTYLREMLDKFPDEQQAIAAYNTGPGNVQKAIDEATKKGDAAAWRDHLPAQETRDYLTRIEGFRGSEEVDLSGRPSGLPGIASLEDLKKLAGWDRLSRDAKLQAINRAGLGDLSEIPPDLFDKVTRSGGAFDSLQRQGMTPGGSSATPVPAGLEEAFKSRFVDPVSDLFSPETSRLNRVLAAADVATSVYPPSAIAAGIGAGVAGVTSWWTEDPVFSSLLGGATEMVMGVGALGRPARRGKKLLQDAEKGLAKEAAAGAPAGLRASEQLGNTSRLNLRSLIKKGKQKFGPQISEVIADASTRNLSLPTTHPEYQKLLDVLTGFNESQFLGVPQDILAHLSEVETRLRNGVPIPVRDLRESYSRIRNWTKYVDEFNPNSKVMLQFADRSADALNIAVGAGLESVPALHAKFKAAQKGWKTLVAEPERVLHNVLMPTVSPTQAFQRLFSAGDPEKLRTAGMLISHHGDEAARLKLRLGFLQMVSDKTQEFTNPTSVMGYLRDHEAVLTQARLFTSKELKDINHLMRKYSVTSIKSLLETGMKARVAPAAMLGASGALGAATAIGSGAFTRNPETGRWDYDAKGILLAALATAGAPYLFRALLNPRDSKASRAAVSRLIGGAATGMESVFNGEQTFANEAGTVEQGGY